MTPTLLLLGSLVAQASTSAEEMDLKQLAATADRVVSGEVLTQRVESTPSGVYTFVTILVDETLRGRAVPVVDIRIPGGKFGDIDVVVPSLGSIRNVEWLDGAGLATGQWGVGCDAGCRAYDINGVVTDHIFVAGDIARAPHVLYGYQYLALEHWDNAVSGAEVAANNMLHLEVGRRPHLPLPSFWSGQFGVNIKSVGVCSFGDDIVFTQGSPEDRRFAAAYGKNGRIVGAVTFNHGKWLPYYAELIERSAPFPPPPPGFLAGLCKIIYLQTVFSRLKTWFLCDFVPIFRAT
jgi:hypothetical protein